MNQEKIPLGGNAAVGARALGTGPLVERGRRAVARATFPAFVFWLLLLRLLVEFGRWGMLSRAKVFMTLGFLASLIWAWRRIPRHPIVWAQAMFFAWCVQAVLTADNNFWAYMSLKEVYANTVIALAMALLFSQPGRLATGIWAFVGIMVYGAFHSLTHGGNGAGGALGDPNENSMAMSCAFALAFCGFEHLKGWRRVASGALAVLFAVTVIASFSRGGFVALAMVLLYCVFTSRRKLTNLGLATLGAVALLVLAPAQYIEELESITQTDEGTANSRQFLWAAAFNMWKANPIMGVGGGGYRFQVVNYLPTDFKGTEKQREAFENTTKYAGRSVHSLYFQLLPEQGLFGVGIWGYMIFAHFRTLQRLRRRMRGDPRVPPDLKRRAELYGRGLAGAMVGYLTGGAFVSVAYFPFAWYFSGMALAVDLSLRSELSEFAHARGSAQRFEKAS